MANVLQIKHHRLTQSQEHAGVSNLSSPGIQDFKIYKENNGKHTLVATFFFSCSKGASKA